MDCKPVDATKKNLQRCEWSQIGTVVYIRGFPKVDHSGRSAKIVLEQINSAKKTFL